MYASREPARARVTGGRSPRRARTVGVGAQSLRDDADEHGSVIAMRAP